MNAEISRTPKKMKEINDNFYNLCDRIDEIIEEIIDDKSLSDSDKFSTIIALLFGSLKEAIQIFFPDEFKSVFIPFAKEKMSLWETESSSPIPKE